MASLNPMTWDLDFFLLSGPNDAATKNKRKERVVLAGIYLSVAALARQWLVQVIKHVPEPYLDEVFHIPQAQAYCRGELDVWDPKLTTPPGLYIISALLIKFLKWGSCTAQELRAVDCLALISVLFVAQGCRNRITAHELRDNALVQKKDMRFEANTGQGIDWDAVHTAVNICLFPPLFFFSGLYYTDIMSTCIVLGAYYHFLKDGEAGRPKSESGIADQEPVPMSFLRGFVAYVIGLAALLMRQTNIFWVAVFMGGMEVVRYFSPEPTLVRKKDSAKAITYLKNFIGACSTGSIHDPRLAEVAGLDILWFVSSLVLAAFFHMKMLLVRLWPYVALLVSFGLFVVWNGGVVLGDKSNHVATLHLSQMLYIWPFTAFFSLPLIYQIAVDFLLGHLPEPLRRLAYFPRPARKPEWSTVAWLLGSLAVSLVVVHFNTIIHPFTLADNRHYIFYVFRYTIRRHRLVKYALAPIYVICGWLVLHCLAGAPASGVAKAAPTEESLNVKPGKVVPRRAGKLFQPFRPRVSFAFIWLVSTALSLVTAPLVEPRYFIIPWVIWRLHVPNLTSTNTEVKGPNKRPPNDAKDASTASLAGFAKYWTYNGHDHRLWLETIWYLLISTVTGCIFLFKGFEWPQEPGKVQRFMW